MFEKLKRLVQTRDPADDGKATTVETAVARLLVRAAMVDGAFDANERRTVSSILARRLAGETGEAERLVAEAEHHDRDSVEIFGSTKTVKNALDHEARLEVLEELWEVVLADGVIDDYEATLMRRMAGLLHVTDRENGEARRRAARRRGSGT